MYITRAHASRPIPLSWTVVSKAMNRRTEMSSEGLTVTLVKEKATFSFESSVKEPGQFLITLLQVKNTTHSNGGPTWSPVAVMAISPSLTSMQKARSTSIIGIDYPEHLRICHGSRA